MSRERVIQQLQTLRTASNVRISNSVIIGMTRSLTSGTRTQLIRSMFNPAGAGYILVPTNGTDSLLQRNNISARRRLLVLDQETANNFTHSLNNTLSGGDSYPVLTAVLGVAAGIASFGAGLMFTVATTALSMSGSNHRVIARGGDELWQVEEIGKATSSTYWGLGSDRTNAFHISAFFLRDPHRDNYRGTKSWLIHEERSELTLL